MTKEMAEEDKKILQEMYPKEEGIINAFEQLEKLVNFPIKENEEALDEIIEK